MSYGLHLAKIVGYPAWSDYDDRLFVRITPEMDNISENLPCWPYFFKDEQFVGKTDDLVWVICDDEFSVGYILGFANYFSYPEDQETFKSYSIRESLKNYIDNCLVDLKASKFAWGDMKVSFWNDTCIHFIERSTGGMIVAYDVGSIFIMRPTEFIVKISNTVLKMDSTGFTVGADKIRMQSEDVGLGENPVNYVVVTSGSSGGENATVSETVRA